jgi:CPA1 family monovalent cation:H+ antiporter
VHEVELILALLVAVAVLATAAQALRLPYPIVLVLAGLLLALMPAVPNVQLAPELVFLLFLPPLLYIAGFGTSVREIRAQLRAILSLTVGLVLLTTAVVAVVAHLLLPELGWPIAFALGAIVSPPDAVAATSLLRGLGVPRRLVTLLEGESLFNDATALVAYQAALAAAATASFSLADASLRFIVAGLGGILVGVAVGAAVALLRRRLHDPPVEITVSLLTPFAAYLPAERLGLSGVLATVTAGLCVGWLAPRIMQSDTRLRANAVWDMVVFLLNSLVFILIGLQLSTILSALSSRSLASLIGLGATIAMLVIVVRLVWVFGMVYGVWLGARLRHRDMPRPDWAETFVVGWAGMRGVVSLATALALPLWVPERELLIFITFCVILATLVGQGLTLPAIIRALGVGGHAAEERAELRARTVAAEAAVARIEELAEEWPTHLPLIDTLRSQYSHRASHLDEASAANEHADGVGSAEQELVEHRKIRRAVIDAERGAILDLRDRGGIDDESWRKIERDLDLEELRMEA